MPTANRKDLVNDKMQIYYNSERQEEKENRIYNEDFHNNLSNLTNGSFDDYVYKILNILLYLMHIFRKFP